MVDARRRSCLFRSLHAISLGKHDHNGAEDLVPCNEPFYFEVSILSFFRFQIHRTLNFLAVCFIVISTVLIFVHVGSWAGPWFGQTSDENMAASAWHALVSLK